MRLTTLIPMAFSLIAFILSLLCVLAGHKAGFMEDYHIVAMNASTLGSALVNSTAATTTTTTSPAATHRSGRSGIRSLISSSDGKIDGDIHNVTSTLAGDLDNIKGDLADELFKILGIKQWYSMHLMDQCEGDYSPSATAPGASYKVSSCTVPKAKNSVNFTSSISSGLAQGGSNATLGDLNYPSQVQTSSGKLNTSLESSFALYVLGITASGLAIIGAICAFFSNWGPRFLDFVNCGLCAIGFFGLMLASIIITVAQTKLTNAINKYGNDIGLFAHKGTKFTAITWTSMVFILLAACCWAAEFFIGRKMDKKFWNSEKPAQGYEDSLADMTPIDAAARYDSHFEEPAAVPPYDGSRPEEISDYTRDAAQGLTADGFRPEEVHANSPAGIPSVAQGWRDDGPHPNEASVYASTAA